MAAKRAHLADSAELGSEAGDLQPDLGVEEDGGEQAVAAALEAALQAQSSLEQVNDEASDRVLAVEQEFNRRRQPLYARRGEALSAIPGFWRTVFAVHPVLRDVLTEADLGVLEYLREVVVEDFADIKSGFSIRFSFDDGNPYFANKTLAKELHFADDGSLSVNGTDIQWLPGMEPAGDDEEAAAAAGSKRAAPEEAPRSYALFGDWFSSQQLVFGGHDDLADVLKDDVWPEPLRWFRAAAAEEAEAQGEGEYEEAEEEDEGEFDEDEQAADEGGASD